MKLILTLLLAGCLAAVAATEEQINKRFTVQAGGKLVVDVDFGSIEVKSGPADEVEVDVWRKVTRSGRADEDEFLREHAVNISEDGNTVTIRSRRTDLSSWSWTGRNRNEAKYTLVVPAKFNAQLNTSGGGIILAGTAQQQILRLVFNLKKKSILL